MTQGPRQDQTDADQANGTGATPRRGARRIRAAVLFADLIGFTALTDRVGPEDAYGIVTGCLRLLDAAARRHGGAVDKYLGDSLMCLFGYPVEVPNASLAAIRAAELMRERVAEYRRSLPVDVPLGIHIGINTGPMVAGEVGASVVREFHVMGDTVNTAARLKAKAPDGDIFIGPETYADAQDLLEVEPLEPLRLKGKQQTVATYAVRKLDEPSAGQIGSGALALTPMVGRDEELQQLRSALGQLADGRGGVVTVRGAEGSGKTRLLAELVALPEASRVDWLQVEWRESASVAPLSAFRRVLPDVPIDPDELASALIDRSEARPLVLVLENAHAADAESVRLLERLAEETSRVPLLLVATLPPESQAGALLLKKLSAASDDRHRSIELGPLLDADAEALLEALSADRGLDPETRQILLERAHGNPGDLVLSSALSGAVRADADRAQTRAEHSGDTERRRATILFADLTGFTAMSERLDPADAHAIVGSCLDEMGRIAERHGGTVEKHLGDCVMALFGAPVAIEDAPRAAVNAAIEMRQRAIDFTNERDLPSPLRVHSGIDTGLSISGDISGPLIREHALMGDSVHLADRLSDRASADEIYVGPETWRATRDAFEYEEREGVRLEGQAAELAAYEMKSAEAVVHRRRAGDQRTVFSELVGREVELASLRGRIAELAEGRGSIVHLAGEAGLGKSRLLVELEGSAETEAVDWFEGRSLSVGQNLSFHPFSDLLRAWARVEDEDEDDAAIGRVEARVRDLLPESADDVIPFVLSVMGMSLPSRHRTALEAASGEALEKLVLRAITDVVRAQAEHRPTVLVFDDLHWADGTSIELLESLLRLAETHPIFFLLVARPHFATTSDRVAKTARERHPERFEALRLQRLDREAARLMIRKCLRGGELPHDTRVAIEEKSQGNPLFVEEVLRALLDQGAVERQGDRLVATERIHDIEVPGTIQEVVMARIDRLDRSRRQVMQAASAIGGSFLLAVLEEVVGRGDLPELMESLVAAELLAESDQLRGDEYSFKHPVIHEVTYDSIVGERRRDLHAEIGNAIERRLKPSVPGFLAMLAYHYSLGGAQEKAESYLFEAGEEASKSAASNEALHFFRQASKLYLDVHGSKGDPEKLALLEQRIASALSWRGQFVEAVDHFNRALELQGERVAHSDLSVGWRFIRDLAVVMARLYVPGVERVRGASTERQRAVINLMFDRAQAQTTTSPARFLFDGVHTLRLLQRVDPKTVPGAGRMYAGTVGPFSFGGISFGASRRFLSRSDALAEGAGDRMMFHAMDLCHHLLEGDWSAEHEAEAALVDEALSLGRLWEATTYLGLLAEKQVYQGDLSKARSTHEQITKIMELYEYDLAKTNHYYMNALLAMQEERWQDALVGIQDYFDENPEDPLHILALGGKAKIQTMLNDLDGAEASLGQADLLMRANRPVPPYYASAVLRSRLMHALAKVEALDAAGAGADRKERARWLRLARKTVKPAMRAAANVAFRRTEVARLAGLADWYAGRESAAHRWWEKSLAAGEALGARPELARTHQLVAERIGEGRLAGLDGREHARRATELSV